MSFFADEEVGERFWDNAGGGREMLRLLFVWW